MQGNWRSQYLRYKEFYLNIVEVYKRRPDLKMFVETILSLSTIVIFIVFALKPTIITIVELLKDIQGKKDNVLLLETKLENLGIASNIYAQQEINLPYLLSSIPNLPEPDSYTREITAIAAKDLVTILSISMNEVALIGTSTKKSDDDFEAMPSPAVGLPVTISVSGTYADLLNFLKDIENTRRPMKIDNLAINTSSSDGTVRVVLIISGRLPYLNQNEK